MSIANKNMRIGNIQATKNLILLISICLLKIFINLFTFIAQKLA